MKNKVQLRPEMGVDVLRHLGGMTALPQEGYLAGQSVCSALLDLYVGQGEGAVYNDFDVFFHATESEHAIKDAYNRTVRYDAVTMSEGPYGEFEFSSEQRYRVLASYREGLNNLVACRFTNVQMPVFELVRTFDLNCVQVGINLRTGLIEWTPAFARFFATRELEVSQVNTPNHTAIRWFKKKAELPNVFGNDDTAMELISLIQHCSRTDFFRGSYGEFTEFGDLRWRFGQKQYEVYQHYEDKLSKYFKLEDNTSIRNLKYLSPKHEVAADYKRIAERMLHMQPLLSLPKLLRLKHTAPVQQRVQQVLANEFGEEAGKAGAGTSTVRASALFYGLDYVAGNVADSHPRGIVKFVDKHARIRTRVALQPTVLLQYQAVRNMQKLEKEFGRWTTGVLEVDADFAESKVSLLDMPQLRKRMTAFKENAIVRLRRRYLPSFRLFGLSVRELSTRLALMDEGEEMHHCVGGYASPVAKGDACIFSIRGDAANPLTWSTVELSRYSGVWQVVQHGGVANESPARGHLRVTTLLAMALNLTKPCSLGAWKSYISSEWDTYWRRRVQAKRNEASQRGRPVPRVAPAAAVFFDDDEDCPY